MATLKCPVCRADLPTDAPECPNCGLPKELWPTSPEAGGGKASSTDDLFGDLMKDLEGMDEEGAEERPSTPSPVPPVPVREPSSSGPSVSPRSDATPRSAPEERPEEPAPPTPEPSTPTRSPLPPTPPPTRSPAVPPGSSKAPGPSPPQPRPEPPVEEVAAAPPPVPAEGAMPLPAPERHHAGHVEAVVVAPQPEDEGMPLQVIMDEVTTMIQVGRRAAFDMTSFGPTAARAVGLVRAGASEEARRMLTGLRKRLYDYLAPRFSGRVEQLEVKLNRYRTFLRTDQASVHLERVREALGTGDFQRAQLELRRLEGETNRLEEELGSLGQTLEQVDLLTAEVERMGGDATSALLYQGKALDAARAGDRRKAEGLLTTASAMLLDTLAPLMGKELIHLTERIKVLRGHGRDIRAAVGLIRQITVDLKTRNYSRGVASLARLREEVARQEEAVQRAKGESAGSAAPSPAPQEPVRVKIKGKGSAVAVSSSGEVVGSSAPSPPAAASVPPPVREAPTPPVPAPKSEEPVPALEVKPGRSYLLYEQRARKGAQIFIKLMQRKNGLFLTTTFPPRITEETPLRGAEVVWLSESPGWEDSLNPRALEHEVAARIHAFFRSENAGAIAVDGLAYIISENGVDTVEKFLKSVLDTAAAKGIGVVATLAPGGIEPKAQARLASLFDYAQ
ncbi:MAG: DUF835 domain-containing protein [Euryarchaeota archaeon]|nr:DUF835 domain-containing protein [Euryarchaeota archaeon]